MIKKCLGIFLLSLAQYGYSMSEIKSIDSLEQASADLAMVDQSTLVVFDIDKTLTYEVDAFRQKWFRETAAGKQFWKAVDDYYRSKKQPKEFMHMVESKRMKYFWPDEPVEPITLSVLDMIQKKGAKVIALTACKTGKFGVIDCIEEWRFQQLSDVGIDFSGSFTEQKIVIETLRDKEGKHPVFYKGVLLSEEDSIDKGPALGALLDRLHFRPGKVFFFDDKLINVRSVQAEMARRSIPYIGFEYNAAAKLPRSYNPAILERQLDHLKQFDEFISDEAAEHMLPQ